MPCSSSTACRFPDDVLHEANICFNSLPLAECEGLLGMPTSTKVSEPGTNRVSISFSSTCQTVKTRLRRKNGAEVVDTSGWLLWEHLHKTSWKGQILTNKTWLKLRDFNHSSCDPKLSELTLTTPN